MPPKHSARELSRVSKCNKAVMYLTEKIDLSHNVPLGMSYSIDDHELTVNKSRIYIR